MRENVHVNEVCFRNIDLTSEMCVLLVRCALFDINIRKSRS